MNTTFVIDDIKNAIHKLDVIKRPYIVFMNPDDAEKLRNVMPKIEDSIVIQSNVFIEQGKSVVMKRESLEQCAFGIDLTEL